MSKIDYSTIRGFNYTPSKASFGTLWTDSYDHDLIDREMGYAEKLRLNSARVFFDYGMYIRSPELFLKNIKDFVRTAWKHGVSTHPVIYGSFRFHPDDLKMRRKFGEAIVPLENDPWPVNKTIKDPSCWVEGEKYFDAVYKAIGDEPGLLFWDITNEPGYMDNFITWYKDEPEYLQTYRKPLHHEKEFREAQELTWACVRHFCKYVKKVDPDHDIGVGNCFIWDTEPSGTAELVDVIIFHDYSATRARLRRVMNMAIELGKKYNKPIIDNETCCLCRSNPYDMTLELSEEYHIGWYAFELMIGDGGWNRAHGIVYPDGTVRDTAIISALFGFYRNRGEGIIRADVNQEDYVYDLLHRVHDFMDDTRNNKRLDHSKDVGEALELCELAANMLEAGELVPMTYPPTAKVAAYRRMEKPDIDEIKDWLGDMCDVLKDACRIK